MTIQCEELQNAWPVCKRFYRPIASKISSLIASQFLFTENDTPLQKNAVLISECIGTIPEKRFEEDWEGLVANILQPGLALVGIGACIGPNVVSAAVKEALSDPDMYLNHIRMNSKFIVGIISGSEVPIKTVKWIEHLLSMALFQNVDCKVIQYDEMQDIIAVLVLAKQC